MDKVVLKANKREVTGKQVKALRRAGELPAVIYGRHVEPISISLDAHTAGLALAKLTSSTLVTIDVNGTQEALLVADYFPDVNHSGPTFGVYLHWTPPSLPFDPVSMIQGAMGR